MGNKKENLLKMLKYCFSSGTAFVLDILLFSVFNHILNNIVISTILARVISSFYNYIFNSRIVFRSYNKKSIIQYYSLVIVQMFVSAFLVNYLSRLLIKINDTIIKFFVDIVIFIVNYFIQKEIIFR